MVDRAGEGRKTEREHVINILCCLRQSWMSLQKVSWQRKSGEEKPSLTEW